MWLEPKLSGLFDFSLESIIASASSQGRDVSIRNRGLNVRSDMWLMGWLQDRKFSLKMENLWLADWLLSSLAPAL